MFIMHFTRTSVCIFLVATMLLAGCGFRKDKFASNGLSASIEITDPVLNQKAMAALARCVACHSNTASLDSMVSSGWVIPGNADGSVLYQKVHDGTMAPGNPLSTSDVTVVHDWIQTGMIVKSPIPSPTPTPSASASPPAGSSALAQKAFAVLQTNCAGCHGQGSVASGGIDYILDFQKLIANNLAIPGNAAASPIYVDISGGTMPPGGKLSASDIQTVFDWIQSDLTSGGPQPMPSAIPLAPTFTSISANILLPKCAGCHGATTADEGVRYDTYTNTLRTVTKGAPGSSKLYTVCRGGDMPQGAPNLSAAELQTISDWITGGAPNN